MERILTCSQWHKLTGLSYYKLLEKGNEVKRKKNPLAKRGTGYLLTESEVCQKFELPKDALK